MTDQILSHAKKSFKNNISLEYFQMILLPFSNDIVALLVYFMLPQSTRYTYHSGTQAYVKLLVFDLSEFLLLAW